MQAPTQIRPPRETAEQVESARRLASDARALRTGRSNPADRASPPLGRQVIQPFPDPWWRRLSPPAQHPLCPMAAPRPSNNLQILLFLVPRHRVMPHALGLSGWRAITSRARTLAALDGAPVPRTPAQRTPAQQAPAPPPPAPRTPAPRNRSIDRSTPPHRPPRLRPPVEHQRPTVSDGDLNTTRHLRI